MSDRSTLRYRPAILAFPLIAVFLAACGPESNSRYGDQYWDPWDTKETFDPVDPPKYSVEYVRTSEDPEVYEARITLDATESYKRLYSHSWGFIRGTKSRESLAPLDADTDTALVYAEDPDTGDDERLVADIPGDYRIFLIGEAEGPLGKRTLRFDDMAFSLPGCPTTETFYDDYIDDTLESCAECHDNGDASARLSLPDNSSNDRRTNFLEHVDDRIEADNLTLPDWIVNPIHDGSGTISRDSQAYQRIAELVDMLGTIKTETGNIRADGSDVVPTAFCIEKPPGFAFTVE